MRTITVYMTGRFDELTDEEAADLAFTIIKDNEDEAEGGRFAGISLPTEEDEGHNL